MSEDPKKIIQASDKAQSEEIGTDQAVLNKVVWHKKVEDLVEAASISGKPVSVLLMDLDSFKSVNDTLGHAEGDRVIEAMREILSLVTHELRDKDKEELRQPDYVSAPEDVINEASAGRFGGDEFGVVCETGEAGAKLIAERIRKSVHSFLELPESEPLKKLGIDISIGIATLQPEDSASDLLRRADLGLYDEKMSHLPYLSPEQIRKVRHVEEILKELNIRPRDLPKHLGKIALDAVEQQSHKHQE